MRIGINATFLENTSVGSGQVIYNFLKELASIDKKNKYFLYVPHKNIIIEEFGDNFNERVVINHFRFLKGFAKKLVWEQVLFPFAAKKDRVDIIHCPYLGVSFFASKRSVVTIFDLIHRVFIDYQPSWKIKIYFKLVEYAAKKSKQVTTLSEYSKQDIVRLLKIPANKVKVVYCGINQNFKILNDRNSVSSVLDKYSIRGRYIFYVGGFDIRKNVTLLIRVFARLKKERGITQKLVLAGDFTEKCELPGMVKKLGLIDEINFIGFVPLNDLPVLYNGSDLFVYPSLYEGFGLPPLEAMACGVPVICSNSSSLSEVVDDAALLINPRKKDDMENAIYRVLTDEEFKKGLITKGLERAKLFSWKNYAKKMLEIYKENCV